MQYFEYHLNNDGTFCVDFFTNQALDLGTLIEIVKNIREKEKLTERELRAFPFRVIKCDNCGQQIITNRDRTDYLDCKICGKETSSDKGLREYTEFTKTLDRTCGFIIQEDETDMRGNMLLLIEPPYKNILEDLLTTLECYGFKIVSPKKPIFELLYNQISKYEPQLLEIDSEILCAQTELTNFDTGYNYTIPRIEECNRFILNTFKNVHTAVIISQDY